MLYHTLTSSTNFEQCLLSVGLYGLSKVAQVVTGFIFLTEMVPPEEAGLLCLIMCSGEPIGQFLSIAHLQYTKDVTTLIMVSIVLQVAFLLWLHFVAQESCPYLFKIGLKEEYRSSMRYIEKFNGVSEYKHQADARNLDEEELPLVLSKE